MRGNRRALHAPKSTNNLITFLLISLIIYSFNIKITMNNHPNTTLNGPVMVGTITFNANTGKVNACFSIPKEEGEMSHHCITGNGEDLKQKLSAFQTAYHEQFTCNLPPAEQMKDDGSNPTD